MTGENLDLLPSELVAINPSYGVDETDEARFWPLKEVSDDGTKAYFELLSTRNYSNARTFSLLAMPKDPPRVEYTDYIDRT